MFTLPKLFKKTSTGAQQEWAVSVDGGTIVTNYGQTGGAIQEARDTIKSGKNVGKKNETTPEQQAQLEAQSQWEKKKKKGYHENADAAMAGETDELIEGGIDPMLAQSYAKHGHKIEWPAFAQPKLDGHRCIAIIKNGTCTLWSRTRKRITGVPHIEKAVLDQFDDGSSEFILDGELYTHSYKDKFEELSSFIRQETPKPGHEVVEYHIYDIAQMHGAPRCTFFTRLQNLDMMKSSVKSPLVIVETVEVENEDGLMLQFERFTAQGYEGAMIRNGASPYENKRSHSLQKVKTFEDSEFCVTGVEEGRGKMAGHAIFVCKTDSGQEFKAKMMGELESLKKYVKNPKLAIGKQLTVKYQGFTKKNGVPRFPVAVRFREDV